MDRKTEIMALTKIHSEKLSINKTGGEIFRFLCDFNNFEKLLPERVQNWQSDTQSCSFNVEGIAELALRMGTHADNSKVEYLSTEKSAFDFKIHTFLSSKEEQTECEIYLEAELNPFVKIMAERPLKNFVNSLIQQLKEVAETQL